jgi:hypothetical protein
MKSRFDEGHVTAQNTGRVILARGVKRLLRAVQVRFQHWRAERVMCAYSDALAECTLCALGKLRPCAIRARGV